MTTQLNPYLSFGTNAREAMEFYQGVFGGDLAISTFGEMGSEPADGIMHSQLTTPAGYTLMGADTPPEMGETSPNGSISLSGDDADQLRGYFAGLSEGGTVTVPLAVAPWGDEFGMCTDRFGVAWLVNITASS